MNSFFQLAIPLIEESGGRITKLIGDCIVAAFPPDNVIQALEMSIELNKRIEEMRNGSELHSLIYIGMGMSYGRLFEGPIGSSSSKDFAMIGPSQIKAFDAESATRFSTHCLVVTPEFRELCASNETFHFNAMENHEYFELVHSSLEWNLQDIRVQQTSVLQQISVPEDIKQFPRSILIGGGIAAALLVAFGLYKLSQQQKNTQ